MLGDERTQPESPVECVSRYRSMIAAMDRVLTGNNDEEIGLHRLLLSLNSEEDARIRQLLRDFDNRFKSLSANPSSRDVNELATAFFVAMNGDERLLKLYLRSQPHASPTEIVAELRSNIRGMTWVLRQNQHDELLPTLSGWEERLNSLPDNLSLEIAAEIWLTFNAEVSGCKLLAKADVAEKYRILVELCRGSVRHYAELSASRELTAEETQRCRMEEDALRDAEQDFENAMRF